MARALRNAKKNGEDMKKKNDEDMTMKNEHARIIIGGIPSSLSSQLKKRRERDEEEQEEEEQQVVGVVVAQQEEEAAATKKKRRKTEQKKKETEEKTKKEPVAVVNEAIVSLQALLDVDAIIWKDMRMGVMMLSVRDLLKIESLHARLRHVVLPHVLVHRERFAPALSAASSD